MSVENILHTYNQATEWDYESGINWYSGAHKWIVSKAKQYGFLPPIVAAVVAALSPRNKWHNNLKDAETILAAVAGNAKHPFNLKVHTTGVFRDTAFSIAQTGNIDLLKGPKVTAFYDNLLHPNKSEAVTVDVWAARIARGDLKAKAKDFTDKEKARMMDEYKAAAEEVGLTPLQIQAVTWLVARRYAKIKVGAEQLALPL